MSNLRILLADDHEVVRKGLSSLLQSHGWEICGEVSDGRQAVALLRQAVEIDQTLDWAYAYLARGLNAIQQYEDALKAFLTRVSELESHTTV